MRALSAMGLPCITHGRERRRQLGRPSLEITAARPAREPARGKAHVRDLFLGDPLLDLRTPLVADRAKARRKVAGVLQVGGLQPHAHHRHEGELARAARHALPKPLTHAKIADLAAQMLDVLAIQVHVPDLVQANAEQALAKLDLGVGKTPTAPSTSARPPAARDERKRASRVRDTAAP